MHEKYMNQLTLEMIESESIIKIKRKTRTEKAGAAGHTRFSSGPLGRATPVTEHDSEVQEETLTADRLHEDEIGRDTEPDRLQVSDASAKQEWRQFFTMEELTEAFEKI